MGIELNDSKSITVTDNNVWFVSRFIYLSNSSSNTIRSNTIQNNLGFAISLNGSSNNTVIGNSISQEKNTRYGGGSGIAVLASNNTISRNSLIDNSECIEIRGSKNIVTGNIINSSGEGIVLRTSDHVISQNIISGNVYGVEIRWDVSNVITVDTFITENNFEANVFAIEVGLQPSALLASVILRNNFIANEHNIVFSGSRPPRNAPNFNFDNGKDGNYWSDYNGTDANGDDIGDTPYIVARGSESGLCIDNRPLMRPVEVSAVPEFPQWTVLPMFMAAALLTVIFASKRRMQLR